jgi:hypothetical protein
MDHDPISARIEKVDVITGPAGALMRECDERRERLELGAHVAHREDAASRSSSRRCGKCAALAESSVESRFGFGKKARELRPSLARQRHPIE